MEPSARTVHLTDSLATSALECQAPFGLYIHTGTGEAVLAPCGKWSCPACGPRRQRRFIARVMQEAGQWGYFCTFTLAASSGRVRDDFAALQRSWRVLTRWLRRRRGRCVHRFRAPARPLGHRTWVRELGERRARPHLHTIIDTDFICYFCMRAAVARAGFGVVCDFQPVRRRAGVARYVGAYLAAGARDERWRDLRYFRRTQTTLPDFPRSKDWIVEVFRHPPHVRPGTQARLDRRYEDELERRELAAERLARTEPGPPQLRLALIPMKKCVTERLAYVEEHGRTPASGP